MSKCISRHGEYGEHTITDNPFVCDWCGTEDVDAMLATIEGLRAELANEVELRKSYQREVAALRAAGGQEKPVCPLTEAGIEHRPHHYLTPVPWDCPGLPAAPVGGQAEPSDAEDVECVTCRAKVGEHCRSLPDPRYTRNPHGARRAASAGVPFDPETPEAVR